jgi:AcrR family transcriptional regulator
MFAAMVGAVADNGYEGTRVADVVKLSGVSRSAFYKHFDDKLGCYLATLDAIAELVYAKVEKSYDPELPWEQRLRAVADDLLDMILEQPATARFCLVDVYAAGPKAVERLDAALSVTERGLARLLRESPEREDLPREIVRAIVGGIQKTVHTRVRRGDQTELIHELPQLIDWALSYRRPTEPLRRPRRRPDRGAAPPSGATIPRDRLVTAVTETVADRGYPNSTIIEIADRASASLSTFYLNFENKEEALLGALDREREQSLAAVGGAFAEGADWLASVRAGIDGLFGFLAAEPAAARVAVVDAFTAGPDGLEAGDQSIWSFHVFLEPDDGQDPQPPLMVEAIGNSVYALAYRQIQRGRVEHMRELTPTATFVALSPFVGAAEACAVANG